MAVQNTITSASERKLVLDQIRRAKRVIRAYEKCASDFEIDISENRGRHQGDTWLFSLQVQRWENLVAAYDATVRYLRDGLTSLDEMNQMVVSLIISRGGLKDDYGTFGDAKEGRLSLRKAQELLKGFGVTFQIKIQLEEPGQQASQATEEKEILRLAVAG